MGNDYSVASSCEEFKQLYHVLTRISQERTGWYKVVSHYINEFPD